MGRVNVTVLVSLIFISEDYKLIGICFGRHKYRRRCRGRVPVSLNLDLGRNWFRLAFRKRHLLLSTRKRYIGGIVRGDRSSGGG